jgi:hypothetical protein
MKMNPLQKGVGGGCKLEEIGNHIHAGARAGCARWAARVQDPKPTEKFKWGDEVLIFSLQPLSPPRALSPFFERKTPRTTIHALLMAYSKPVQK